MKKINNIGFIIALILCSLMLFAYCSKVNASDVLPPDSDTSSPVDSDYIQPNDRPNFQNTYLISSDFAGEGLVTSPYNNTNGYSGEMTLQEYNSQYTSDRMYYSDSILQQFDYNYKSLYYIAFRPSINFPLGEYSVEVTLNDLDYSITTSGRFVYQYNLFDNTTNNFYKATTFSFESDPLPDFTTYPYLYGFLIVDMPFYGMFTSKSNFYENGFYISSIKFIGQTFGTNLTDERLYISHILDLCTVDSSFSVPPKNDVFLTCVNNSGYYYEKFSVPSNNNYFAISDVNIGGSNFQFASNSVDYLYDENDPMLLYSTFNTDKGVFRVNYFAFVRGDLIHGLNNYIPLLNAVKNNDLVAINESLPSPNSYTIFFSIFTELENGQYINGGISPFYSAFSFYTLMPNGSDSSFGNLSFTDINASEYYIEPQDWKDFGAHFNNIVVWVCFEMPLLSNLTKPVYMFLNGFLEIWVQIALPLAASFGLVGGAFIFYLIYLFISRLLFNKAPD